MVTVERTTKVKSMKIKVKVSAKQFMKLARNLDTYKFTEDDADCLEELVWLIREENFADYGRLRTRLKAKLAELQILDLNLFKARP